MCVASEVYAPLARLPNHINVMPEFRRNIRHLPFPFPSLFADTGRITAGRFTRLWRADKSRFRGNDMYIIWLWEAPPGGD